MAREGAVTGRRALSSRTQPVAATRERGYLLGLIGIVLLGWGLRLLFWWQQSRFAVVPPASDEEEYYRGAVHIYKNLSYYDSGQWLRAPGPSLLLALCFALVGGIKLPVALLLQGLMSGLGVLPTAATARSYFASRRAGLVAGVLMALYLPFALSATQIMSEPAAILTGAVCIWSCERWRSTNRQRWLFWSGVALAVFTLTRPVGFYAQFLIPLWIWWRTRKSHGWWRGIALFLLGFWLLVGPWCLRNTLVFGKPVLVDTNSAFSFWEGTREPNGHLAQQELWNRTVPNLADRQAQQYARALANIRRDPQAFVLDAPGKIVALWQLRVRVLIGNGLYSLVPALMSVPLTLLGDLTYLVIFISVIVCLVYVPHKDAHWMMIGWPLYGTAFAAWSLGHPRLRIPFEVALMILAAYPLAHPRSVWQRIRDARPRRSVVAVGSIMALGLLLYAGVYGRFVRSQLDLAASEVWAAMGQRQRSLGETDAAVRAEPGVALPLVARAQQHTALGLPDRSAAWQQVLAVDPHIVQGNVALLGAAIRAEDEAAIRSQIAAIRDLQWDDDRVYTALWEEAGRRPRSELAVGTADDLGLMRGFSPPHTEGGRTLRWTQGPALVRLPGGGATTLRLQVRGWRTGQQLQLRVDGQGVGRCAVAMTWSSCSVALPAHPATRVVELESSADVPWPPDDYLPRGVAVAGVSLTPGPSPTAEERGE